MLTRLTTARPVLSTVTRRSFMRARPDVFDHFFHHRLRGLLGHPGFPFGRNRSMLEEMFRDVRELNLVGVPRVCQKPVTAQAPPAAASATTAAPPSTTPAEGKAPAAAPAKAESSVWQPWFAVDMDVAELPTSYELRVDLPGVKPEQIKIEVTDDVLTLSGSRQSERQLDEGRVHFVERSSGTFSRSVRLPEGTKAEDIQADYEHGVLKLSIPKHEQPKPAVKTVPIKVSGATATAAAEPVEALGQTEAPAQPAAPTDAGAATPEQQKI